jgi:hypothetical protein
VHNVHLAAGLTGNPDRVTQRAAAVLGKVDASDHDMQARHPRASL